MLRVKAILTGRAFVESNALFKRSVLGALAHEQTTTGSSRRLGRRTCSSLSESVPSSPLQSNRSLITAALFERIWWDKGSDSRKAVSIWRLKPPPGHAVLGDCLVEGLEPPRFGVGHLDDETGALRKPTTYLLWVHISGKGLEDVYIWFPVAPAGYVAVGCIATKTQQVPPVDHVWCVRSDYVTQVSFSKGPFWSMCTIQNKFSLWKVETQAHTFIAQPNLERPPDRLANYTGFGNRRDDSIADTRDSSAADERDRWVADKRTRSTADKRTSSTADKRTSSTADKRTSSTSKWLKIGRSTKLILLGVGALFLLKKYIRM